MKRISLLGSTGSIGVQTLAVVEAFPERLEVVALAAGHNISKLAEQVRRFRPARVSVADEAGAEELRNRIGPSNVQIGVGEEGLEAVATQPAELVVAGLVGAVGLRPTLAAIRAGRDIALAEDGIAPSTTAVKGMTGASSLNRPFATTANVDILWPNVRSSISALTCY